LVQQHLTLVTGLGIATRVANGMEFSSPYVQGLEQAHKIALTAWPIFFAAIVAQSLKAFATFRVERGIRLRVGWTFLGVRLLVRVSWRPFLDFSFLMSLS
jgi:hypothetical protein